MDDQGNDLDLQAVVYKAAAMAKDSVHERPVTALAAAFGVGYVLGGGLPNWMVRVGAAVAMRSLTQAAIQRAASGGGGGAFFGHGAEPEPPHDVDVTPAE